MNSSQATLYIAAGIVAGFTNTLAGFGSAITLPLLLYTGHDIHHANGTNRVAILLQNMIAALMFHRDGRLDFASSLPCVTPSVLGGVLGAHLATILDPGVFRLLVGPLLGLILVSLLAQPKRWLEGTGRAPETATPGGSDTSLHSGCLETGSSPHQRPWLTSLVFFLIGAYGGFVQIGVGLLLLSALVLVAGQDITRANAQKVLIILLYTIPALAVFSIRGHVVWKVGFCLAIGNMSGAWLATRLSIQKGNLFVRRFLILVVCLCLTREMSSWFQLGS